MTRFLRPESRVERTLGTCEEEKLLRARWALKMAAYRAIKPHANQQQRFA